jgi:hypothetical protein
VELHCKVIHAKDFLKVKPSGETDLEESKLVLGKILEMTELPGSYEILLDVRDAYGNLDEQDLWELVAELGQHRSRFRSKIAILAREDVQINKAIFFELCAQMVGFNVSAFTDFEQAIEWLQSPDKAEVKRE